MALILTIKCKLISKILKSLNVQGGLPFLKIYFLVTFDSFLITFKKFSPKSGSYLIIEISISL